MLGRKASYLFGRRSSNTKKQRNLSGLTISAPNPIHPININGAYIDLAVNPQGDPETPTDDGHREDDQSWEAQRGPGTAPPRITAPWDAEFAAHVEAEDARRLHQLPMRPPPRWQSLVDVQNRTPSPALTAPETRRNDLAPSPARSMNFSRKLNTPTPADQDDYGHDARGHARPELHRRSSMQPAPPPTNEVKKLRRVSSVPGQAVEHPRSESRNSVSSSRPESRTGVPLAAGTRVSRSFSMTEIRQYKENLRRSQSSTEASTSRPASRTGPYAGRSNRNSSTSSSREHSQMRLRIESYMAANGVNSCSVSPVEERPDTPSEKDKSEKDLVSPLTPPRALRSSPFPFSSPETDISELSPTRSEISRVEPLKGDDAPLPPSINRLSRIAKRSSAGETLSPLDLRLDKLGREAFDLAYLLSPKDFPLPASPATSSTTGSQTIKSIDQLAEGVTPVSPGSLSPSPEDIDRRSRKHSEAERTANGIELPSYLGKMEDVRPVSEEEEEEAAAEGERKLVRSLSRKLSKKMKGIIDGGDAPRRRPSGKGISKQSISKPVPVSMAEQEAAQREQSDHLREREIAHKVGSWDYNPAAATSAGSLHPAPERNMPNGYPTPDPSSSRSSIRSSDRNPSPETPVTPHEDYASFENEVRQRPSASARWAPRLPSGSSIDSPQKPWMQNRANVVSNGSQEMNVYMDSNYVPEVTHEPPTPEARKTEFGYCHRVETSSSLGHHSDPHEVQYGHHDDEDELHFNRSNSSRRRQRGHSNASARSGHSLGATSATPGRRRRASNASSKSGHSAHSEHASSIAPSVTSKVSSRSARSEHSRNVETRAASRNSSGSSDSIVKSPTELHAPPRPTINIPTFTPAPSRPSMAASRVSTLSTMTTSSVRSQAPFGAGPKLLRMRTMSSRADGAPVRKPKPADEAPPSPMYPNSVRTFGSDAQADAASLRPSTAMSFRANDEAGYLMQDGRDSPRLLETPEPQSPNPFDKDRSLSLAEPQTSLGASPSRKPSLRLARSFSTLRAPSMRRSNRSPEKNDDRPQTAKSTRGPGALSVNTDVVDPPLPSPAFSTVTYSNASGIQIPASPGPFDLERDAAAAAAEQAQKEKAMGTIRRAFSRRAKRPSPSMREDAPPTPTIPAIPEERRGSINGGALGAGKSEASMSRWMEVVKAARAADTPLVHPDIPTPEQADGDTQPAPRAVEVKKLTNEERAAVARLPGSIFLKTVEGLGEERHHRLKPKKGGASGGCVFCGRGPFANMWCCLDNGCGFTCCRVCAGEKVTEGVAELF